MSWADDIRKLGVRTNADTPQDAGKARSFGAEGIGLTRTEHMFFEPSRIMAMREMIVAETPDARRRAVMKLLPFQRQDFKGILEAMEGLPVTIRLLDPPLHEFVTLDATQMVTLAGQLGISPEKLKARVNSLHELNPMLGHRGCRLGIAYPEVTEMQARAIFEATAELSKAGRKVHPEVMIPLVGSVNEFLDQEKLVRAQADAVMREQGVKFEYMVGTMIELPRACVVADRIAEGAEFFSFGTNDLTQTTFGFSRDDVATFLPDYITGGVLPADPFQTIDQEGVGELVKMGVERGRAVKPKLKIGICGEHGGEAESVKFCHRTGLDYVSCSPFRVPIARLAAAHAAIEEKAAGKAPKAAKPAKKVAKKKAKKVAKKKAKKKTKKVAKKKATKKPAKKKASKKPARKRAKRKPAKKKAKKVVKKKAKKKPAKKPKKKAKRKARKRR